MIRFLEKKDKQECYNMLEEFYKTDAVLHQIPLENIKNSIEQALNGNPYIKILICEKDNKYVGFCTLSFSYSTEVGGQVIIIEEIYIRKEYQNKGLGTSIFEFIRNNFDDKVKRYRLEVLENHKAIHLYGRLGFEKLSYSQMILDL